MKPKEVSLGFIIVLSGFALLLAIPWMFSLTALSMHNAHAFYCEAAGLELKWVEWDKAHRHCA